MNTPAGLSAVSPSRISFSSFRSPVRAVEDRREIPPRCSATRLMRAISAKNGSGKIRHDNAEHSSSGCGSGSPRRYSAGNRKRSSAALDALTGLRADAGGVVEVFTTRSDGTARSARRNSSMFLIFWLAHDMAPSRCCGRGRPVRSRSHSRRPSKYDASKVFSCISRAGPVGFGHLRDRRATSHMPSRCGRPRWARDAWRVITMYLGIDLGTSAVKNLRHRHRRRGRGDRIGATHRPDPVRRSERTGPGVLVGGDPRGHRRTAAAAPRAGPRDRPVWPDARCRPA